jgi:hypothetical protein
MNDIQAWAQTAKDLGLATVWDPHAKEIVIFNRAARERGFLWVTRVDLRGTDDKLAAECARRGESRTVCLLSPQRGLALVARLAAPVTE